MLEFASYGLTGPGAIPSAKRTWVTKYRGESTYLGRVDNQMTSSKYLAADLRV
jgi:hypothetical protein